ncbi:GPW/gp25 family protein [Glaciimonas sp. PAMC28666]|nr:GPW/gp25 family protein [Glaciimonas sp. PAMC28666]
MVQGEQDIIESLHILFSTTLCERTMLPAYGCTLEHEVFETIGVELFSRIEDLLKRAILFFEPRILVIDIVVEEDESNSGQLNISLSYSIPQTNTRSNMVYPFYLLEGSNVRQIGSP